MRPSPGRRAAVGAVPTCSPNPDPEDPIFDKKRNARLEFDRAVQPRRAPTKRRAPRPRPTRIATLAVRRRADGWAVLVDDIDEPAWVVSTKQKAVASARKAAAYHRCKLRVFTSAGALQRESDFAAA